jgi:gliotoxin/aspirochlorine biosynthesis aminotransferase
MRHALWILNRYRVSSASAIMGLGLFSDLLGLESIFARNKMDLRRAAEYVGDFLAFHNVSFYRPTAGCFLWARLGGSAATHESDLALWRKLAAAGVALAIGGAFSETEQGWFRITYALPRNELEEGVRRIEIALGVREKWRPAVTGGKQISRQMRTKKSSKSLTLALKWIMGWR